jgi:F-type H+-transporting ATPase subunit b
MAEQKKGGLSPILGIVFGLVLMFGGMWVSKNWKPEFLKTLEEGGIPLDPGKTVAVIGVMLILFPVIRMFFIDPLADAINGRNSELEKTFTEAETLRTEMTQMKSDYEKRLVETEASAREQIQSQIREAQELRKTLMAEASAKADEMLRKAQEDIQAEKARALTEIRVHVATLSLGATEKLLGENMDSDKNRRLIDDFLATTEAKN